MTKKTAFGLDALQSATPGDILLFHNAIGLNRLITWFSRSPYYHAGIFSGGTYVIEARPRGVMRRDLRSKDGDDKFVVLPAPEGKGREALEWAETQIGAKYDDTDIVVLIFERIFRHLHINYTSPDRFSCGEFVAYAYQHAGVTLVPERPINAIVPGDIARWLPPDLQKVP